MLTRHCCTDGQGPQFYFYYLFIYLHLTVACVMHYGDFKVLKTVKRKRKLLFDPSHN